MKKLIRVLFIGFLFIDKVCASAVTSDVAQTAAVNFYKQNSIKAVSNISLEFTQTSAKGNALYYIFNINNNDGFVIVAADNASYPILGYNDTGHYSTVNVPPNFAYWMNWYAEQLTYVSEHNVLPDADRTTEWNAYINGLPNTSSMRTASSVPPLSTIIWNQYPYYNDLCPGGSVTGCVATAMAQIMRYWSYPAHGLLTNIYNENTPQYSDNYGVISRNFYNDYYNWANMPDEIDLANADVALLNYDAGVSVDMNYDPHGSNAQVVAGDDSVGAQIAYVRFFGYDRHTVRGLYASNYTDSAWLGIIENELNNNREVQYAGGGDAGHTWVCEGYNTNSQFYMNWGWGSSDNGYFALSHLIPVNNPAYNFDSLQEAVIGIQPPAASAQFFAKVTSVQADSSVAFTDESLSPTSITSWSWSFPGGTPASSSLQNPVVTYQTAGLYNVTLLVTAGGGGGDSITQYNYIVVQPNSNPLPLKETFENNPFPPSGWYLNNPNAWTNSNDSYGSIWQQYSHSGGGSFGNSNTCMMFYNFNYGFNAYKLNQPPPPNPLGGQRQQIYTPAYDFSNVENDSLYFDVAYAPFNSLYSDTLAVYYSLDCGKTWANIYLKGGSALATGDSISASPGDTTGFIPSTVQWRTEYVKLSSAVYGQAHVMFSFENRSYWGGQLYVDNINIPGGNPLSIKSVLDAEGKIKIYPDPNDGNFNLTLHGVNGDSYINIYNILGENIYASLLNPSNTQIDLTEKARGVYFYRVITEKGNLISQGKFIIE